MKNSTTTIIAAVVGAVGLIGGNLVTAIGPASLSWGARPSYTDTDSYKRIIKAYPRLDDTLETLLIRTDAYYRSRSSTLEFKNVTKDRVVIGVTNTTDVQNVAGRVINYQQSVSAMEDTEVDSITVTYQNGQKTRYQKGEFRETESKGGLRYVTVPFQIPKDEHVTIETRYTMKKPLVFMEPLVVNRLLLGNFNLTIKMRPPVAAEKIDIQSLSFDELITKTVDPNGDLVVNVAGPIFPGQGVAIAWRL